MYYRSLYSLQDGADELFDTGFVVGVCCLLFALCDDAANGHSAVSHVQSKTCYTRAFIYFLSIITDG